MMIIATGGMERSGTNYTNYVMFLHPDLKGVNYPSPHEVESGMSYQQIAQFHKYPNPIPFSVQKEKAIKDWHEKQDEKTDFTGICFKGDRAEVWCKDVLDKLPSPVMFVYCGRPVPDLVFAWQMWAREDYTDAKFLECFLQSVESAESIRSNPRISYASMNVSWHLKDVRSAFAGIHKRVGLKMEHHQKLFLKKRRVVGGPGKKRKKGTSGELLEGLHNLCPDLDGYISRYDLLVGNGG